MTEGEAVRPAAQCVMMTDGILGISSRIRIDIDYFAMMLPVMRVAIVMGGVVAQWPSLNSHHLMRLDGILDPSCLTSAMDI